MMPLSLEPGSPTTTLEWARYYAAMGWSVVPVRRGEKNPAVAWAPYQQRCATDAELRSWFSTGEMGIGIITGAISNIFVVDFDGEEGAATHARLAPQLGLAPASLTGGGGMHLLFRHPGRRVPTRTALAPGMDIRGDGGFIVAPPSLHASGRPYAWDVDAHPDDIPIVDAPSDFVAAICADAPPGPGGVAPVTRAPGPLGLDMGLVTDGRETYMRNTVLAVARGLYDRLGRLPTEAEVYDEGWPQYSARVDLSRPGRGEAEFRAKVRYTVARLARGAVPSFSAPAIGSSAPRGDGAPGGGEKAATPLWIDAGEWLATDVPKRPWVVPGYLMRGSVSVLSGQGAGGKSSLVVAWSIAGATGEPLGEFRPVSPLVIVNYNTEDDMDEQRRRYSAALIAMKKDVAAIQQRVIRCGPNNIGTLFARDPKSGAIGPTEAMQVLESVCTDSGADVLICDPLAELHNAEENDNTAMRAVIAAFRSLAKRLNIAVLILHHDRKGSNAPGDMDRVRGASAIGGAVRVMLTLSTMSQDEADKFGVQTDERRRFFRVDGAKSNYALAQEAEWWKLTGYDLPNGDVVAAALPWAAPSPWGSLPMKLIVQVLDAIAAGRPNGDLWSPRKEAKDGWAGRVLVDMAAVTEGQAAEILRQWVENNLLTVEEYITANRKPRRGLRVDPVKIQQMRQQVYGAEVGSDE